MRPDLRLCDLLYIEHPTAQAPKPGTWTLAFISPVSNAAGMEALAWGRDSAEVLEEDDIILGSKLVNFQSQQMTVAAMVSSCWQTFRHHS